MSHLETHLQPKEVDIEEARKDPRCEVFLNILESVETDPQSCTAYVKALDDLAEVTLQIPLSFDPVNESLAGEGVRVHNLVTILHREECSDFNRNHGINPDIPDI